MAANQHSVSTSGLMMGANQHSVSMTGAPPNVNISNFTNIPPNLMNHNMGGMSAAARSGLGGLAGVQVRDYSTEDFEMGYYWFILSDV